MKIIFSFIVFYAIMFIIDYCILKKYTNEYEYMRLRFNLKKRAKYSQKMQFISSLINSFIMSMIITFSLFIPLPFMFKLPLDFILIILLIYCLYGIYGLKLWRYQSEAKKRNKKTNK